MPGYTECPGDLFHSTFNEVRDSIESYAARCALTAVDDEALQSFRFLNIGKHMYKIPAVNYKTIKIFNIQGQLLLEQPVGTDLEELVFPAHQLLLAVLSGEDRHLYKFKLILNQ